MEITPAPGGALMDVTDSAIPAAADIFASAFAKHEQAMTIHLLNLAKAVAAVDTAKAAIVRPGVDVIADQRLEIAEQTAEALRDLIAGLLAPDATVSIVITERGCRKYGQQLLDAAKQAGARWAHLRNFPHQQDRSAA